MNPSTEQYFTPALSKLIQPKSKQPNVHRFGRFQPNNNPLKTRCKSFYQLNEVRERTKAMVSLINKVSDLYTTTIKSKVTSIDKLAKLPSYQSEPPHRKNPTPAGIIPPQGSEERDYVYIIQPLDMHHSTDFKPLAQNSTQKYQETKFKPSFLSKKGNDYEESHGLIEEIAYKNLNLRNKYRSCFIVDSPKKRMSYFLPNSKQLNLSKVHSKINIKPYRQPMLKPVNTEKSLAAQPYKLTSEVQKNRNITPDLQTVTQGVDNKKVILSYKSNVCINTNLDDIRHFERQTGSNLFEYSMLDASKPIRHLDPGVETPIQLASSIYDRNDYSIFKESENLSGWNIPTSPKNQFEVTF